MSEKDKTPSKSEIRKENQDFPNIPASTQKNESGDTMKKEIKKTSELNEDGKTDNIDKNGN